MSLHADLAAVVVLPPGVSAKGIVVRLVDENDVDKEASRLAEEFGREVQQIVEVRLGTSSVIAMIVETK